MDKTTKLVLAGIVLLGNQVHAYSYTDTIRRQQDIANYNGYRAAAESKYYKRREKLYRKLNKNLRKYGYAHARAMAADASLVGLEGRMYSSGYRPMDMYASD